MTNYPSALVPPAGLAPVPRRIRGVLDGQVVLDSEAALYVWEIPAYPQYYIPLGDIAAGLLVDEGVTEETPRGPVQRHAVRLGDVHRPGAAWVLRDSGGTPERLRDTVRLDWDCLDQWYEEDEVVYVHPRNPYSRVDALRSSRSVRVELNGVVLAEASTSIMVVETGLPPRYYLDRTSVRWEQLAESTTQTACPYKGETSQYWAARGDGTELRDLAWSYAFPTVALASIAGLVAFFNERVDLYLDDRRQQRPSSSFS